MGATGFSAAMGVNSLINAKTQANAAEAQGEYQKQVNERNAKYASQAAQDVTERGDTAAVRRQVQTDKTAASQKVALAVNGAQAGTEVYNNNMEQTAATGAADVAAIKTNAFRQAFGFENQAVDSIQAGEMASLASQNTARNTMATGTMEAAGYGLKAYQAYKENHKPDKGNA